MGEIAEMMLEGDMCQWCGEMLGGDGYPTVCAGCQQQHGVDQFGEPVKKKKKRRRDDPDAPFIVAGEKAFTALRWWLKERGCNTYSWSDQRYIQVGYDSKPDSDWGKYENHGFIIVRNPDKYFKRTCEEIEKAFIANKAYGWEQSEATQ